MSEAITSPVSSQCIMNSVELSPIACASSDRPSFLRIEIVVWK